MSWSSWAPMVRRTSLPGRAFSEVIQAIHFAVFTDSQARPHLKTKASSDCELPEYYTTPHTLPRLTNETPGISRSVANHTTSCAPVTVSVMQTTPGHPLVSAPRPVTPDSLSYLLVHCSIRTHIYSTKIKTLTYFLSCLVNQLLNWILCPTK